MSDKPEQNAAPQDADKARVGTTQPFPAGAAPDAGDLVERLTNSNRTLWDGITIASTCEEAAATITSLRREVEELKHTDAITFTAFDNAIKRAEQAEAAAREAQRDAERYRWLQRKICFTGNGDGTSSMRAINLPDAAGFPSDGEHASFINAAIDAAIAKRGNL